MLAAPLAAPSCKQGRSAIPGKIRGASHEVGHRLKHAFYEKASGDPERIGVAIVGAGPAGLCAAWRLARSRYFDYRIFDLEPHAGGTSAYGTDGVVPYPWGAHYVPVPFAESRGLVLLLREMGVLAGEPSAFEAREQYRIRQPEERLFYDGRWQSGLFPGRGASARDFSELKVFEAEVDRWLGFRDGRGRRAFALPMRLGSDDARVTELDKQSAAEWAARRGIRSSRVLWYLELACGDDYGMTLEQTSAWALLFYFCSRREQARASSQPFVAWPEGNGRIVRHLVERSRRQLRIESLVGDVIPKESEVQLAILDARSGQLRRVVADHVILAVPQFVIGRILRPWRERPPPHLAAFSYGAWLVANLHVKQPPKNVGAPPAWDNVLFDSPSLGYVSAGHQALRDLGPNVWTYYLPLTGDDPALERQRLMELDQPAACRVVLGDLKQAHPDLESVVERLDVYRWGHAMVRPTPGFVWGDARREAVNVSMPRVHFAHSDLSGLALFEEAQDRGVLAAERVLAALGRPAEPLAG